MQTIGQPNRAGLLWLAQAISGALLVALMFLHMVANHFVVEGGLQTYQDVLRYLSNPLVFGLETVFLVVVTLHALLGVRAIVLDTGLSRPAEVRLNRLLAGLGALIVAYGAGLTFFITRR